MYFQPARQIIGASHQIRGIKLTQSHSLPKGEYAFNDFYCTDSGCDCRRVIIQIMLDGQHVSTASYGWEDEGYYVKWGSSINAEQNREMAGLSIDHMSPNKINPDSTLALMKELMDTLWINEIKATYQTVRASTDSGKSTLTPPSSMKTSRNSPCPCNSGKKYKRCCIDKIPDQPTPNSPLTLDTKLNLLAEPKTPFISEIDQSVEEKVAHALTQIENQQYQKAEKILITLLKKHPLQASVHYAMGIYHALQNQIEESIPHFEKAIELIPFFTEAWYNLSIAYRSTDNILNAVISARNAVKFAEPDEHFIPELQTFINEVATYALETCNLPLDEYIDLLLLFNSSFSLMQEGNTIAAIVGFNDILKADPDNHQTLANLGICHAMLGEKNIALAHLKKALEIEPDYEIASTNLTIIETMKEGETLILPIEPSN